MSEYYFCKALQTVEMSEQNGSQLTSTFKPKCIIDYNREMIDIDR